MPRGAHPPEPGIATDEELREAVDALRDAFNDDDWNLVEEVSPERFDPLQNADEWSEVIHVRLTDEHYSSKVTVINEALTSDAPVRLRDLGPERENRLTFYPANQS